jgi:predicted double-glycine peptidase
MKAFCVAACLALLMATARADDSFRVRSLKEIRERAVVMQEFDNSCGAAALATVLTYGLQDPISERYIAARMLETTAPAKIKAQGGFSLLDMKRFVEARGYHAEAYQNLSLADLQLFHAPIVPIGVFGANHYVVLDALDGDRVVLADPAFGRRSMSVAQFNEAWIDGLAFVVTRP